MLALSKHDQKSYNDKYNHVMSKKVTLTYNRTKGIIMEQFSVQEPDADRILTKVFATQPKKELNKDGFFLTLKYVQCLQNEVDIQETNIYSVVLPKKLSVKRKSQPPELSSEEHLIKSIAHLNQIQSIVREIEQPQVEEQQSPIMQENELNPPKLEEQEVDPPKLQQSIEEQYQQLVAPVDVQIDQQVPVVNDDEHQNIIEISDDEQDEPSGDIQIVADYERELYIQVGTFGAKKDNLMMTYYVCRISTQIKQKENDVVNTYLKIVERRYTDFEMLHDYILSAHQGSVIPKLPEKDSLIGNVTKIFVERRDKLEERRDGLERYLQNLAVSFPKDEIFLAFITMIDKFEDILYSLRYKSEVEFRDDDSLPDPQQYCWSSKVKNALRRVQESSLTDYTNMIFSMVSKNPKVEAQFQEEYKLTQKHYLYLQSKYDDLQKFEREMSVFYKHDNNLVIRNTCGSIVDAGTYNMVRQIFDNYKNLQYGQRNTLMDNVRSMKDQLINVFYSYEQLQQNIISWSMQKQKLQSQVKNPNDENVRKNEKEEETLKSIIQQLNQSLGEISNQYTDKLNALLDQLVLQLTSI